MQTICLQTKKLCYLLSDKLTSHFQQLCEIERTEKEDRMIIIKMFHLMCMLQTLAQDDVYEDEERTIRIYKVLADVIYWVAKDLNVSSNVKHYVSCIIIYYQLSSSQPFRHYMSAIRLIFCPLGRVMTFV